MAPSQTPPLLVASSPGIYPPSLPFYFLARLADRLEESARRLRGPPAPAAARLLRRSEVDGRESLSSLSLPSPSPLLLGPPMLLTFFLACTSTGGRVRGCKGVRWR